jgi:integrase
MPSRYRKKPLAQLEHGTRIYAPSAGEARYRIVATDPVLGERIFVNCRTEAAARAKARELEGFIAQPAPIRDPGDAGPRTVERLAVRYIEDHLLGLSLRFREKQTYLLERWVLPRLGACTVTAWTPADSAAVIAAVRRAGGSDAFVQDVGATMRALVTHGRRLRWLTAQSESPLWMVRYAKTATIQGATSVYVPRSSLPTDEQCTALFDAMDGIGHRRSAIAMRLCHPAGLRWGELIALQAHDIECHPARVVHVGRAVEQPTRGPARLKPPKNGKTRTSIFPKSLTDDLAELVDDTIDHHGPEGLLFPRPRDASSGAATSNKSGSVPPTPPAGP